MTDEDRIKELEDALKQCVFALESVVMLSALSKESNRQLDPYITIGKKALHVDY